jgi:hypothetical protein
LRARRRQGKSHRGGWSFAGILYITVEASGYEPYEYVEAVVLGVYRVGREVEPARR